MKIKHKIFVKQCKRILYAFCIGIGFFRKGIEEDNPKENIDKFNYIKSKNFCSTKDATKKMKRQG